MTGLPSVTFGVTFGGMVKRPRCEHCGRAFDQPARKQGGGRVKRFCSSACRVAAARKRDRDG